MVSFPTKSAPLQVPLCSVLSALLFLIYVNDLPNPHHRQNWKSQFADDTALWTASKSVQFAAKLLDMDVRKLAKWCAKWGIKLSPEKTKVIIFSRSSLVSSSEISGNYFRLQIHLPKTLCENPGVLQHQVPPNQSFSQQKWGPSPSTILQVYKDHNNIGHNHQQNSMAPEQIYPAAMRLPKYISIRLLHHSSGLPYVKDRLLSRAAKTLERISKNPFEEESITLNRVKPAWDRFPASLFVIHPVSL